MSGPGEGTSMGAGGTGPDAVVTARPDERGIRRHGASRFAGHATSDRFSRRGAASTSWLTPALSSSIVDGAYLRALLGNLYFGLPLAGLVLGVVAAASTSGLAVPPSLALTLVILALGVLDALSGLAALVGFAVVTLATGNLIGSHMGTAPPGKQTLVYAIGGLFGLGVLWFAGAKVPRMLRPLHVRRDLHPAAAWPQRLLDYAFSAIVGTIVLWFVAWHLYTLAGTIPQELLNVTLQDHLRAVQIVAVCAFIVRCALQETAMHHFAGRMDRVAADPARPRRLPMALVFWAIRGGVCLIVLWEFLGFRWMTWVALALFLAITPFAWVGVRLRRLTLSRYRYPLNVLRILVVVVLIELLVSQLTHHLVNPAPMLGAVLIGIGVLLLLFCLLEPPAGVGSREGVPTIVTDVVALTLLVLMLYGVVGIGASPFSGPRGVYTSATGAVFVADTANNRVVMVYKNGVRTTIGADLADPADVVADGGDDGYLYVADAGNNRIERVNGLQPQTIGDHSFNYALADPATQQTTLPLTGLNDPQSVSVDGVGDVFVADTGNGRIVEWHRKSNRQSTFMSGLDAPLAVLCDPFFTQIVYVADTGAGTVLEVLPNHKVVTVLRGLDEPAGLAEDPWGNLYVSEMGSGVVLEAPNHGFGPATIIDRNLGHPRGLSVDALGNLFIADTTSGQVEVVAHLREHHLVTHGIPGPTAVAYAPSGAVYVVDEHQGWLQEWDQGRLTTVATGLAQPVGVAPGPNGSVWVDLHDGELLLVSPDGTSRVVRQDLAGPAQLWASSGGSVLVAETYGGQVLRVAPDGSSLPVITGLDRPVAVAQDPGGDVAVGLANGTVYEYFAAPKRQTLFNLRGISAIAMDQAGNVYVGSTRFATIVEHVAATGRDVVVNRNFRSLTGLGASPDGTLWVGDQKSLGLFEVVSSPLLLQL